MLLLCSALVSGAETAFFSFTPSQINNLQSSENSKDHSILRLLNHQDKLLSTILICNNLINIGAILVADSIINKILWFHNAPLWEFMIKIIIVTFLLLLFGEIMPKIFAAYNNLAFARLMAPPLGSLRTVVAPLSFLLIKSGNAITHALSGNSGQNVSINELHDAIEITKTETLEDKEMLSGIVRFVGTDVDEIMKPRIDVVALASTESFDKVKQTVISSGFSRIPVYEDNFDHIQGILYIKDLLPFIDEAPDFDWLKLIRKPYFVPEHKKINDLLEDFQSRKIHMSIVVDEYGGTLGIVTLEDILEEIVGEISDESDRVEKFYQKIDDHTYIFEGKTHVGDFERVMKLGDGSMDKIKGDADTLAGVMLEIKGDFFKVGDSVEYRNIKLTARELDNHRITKVTVNIWS